MKEYHKIQTVFKRDLSVRSKPLLEGEWTWPEFEYLKNNPWVFTEKVDGTNIRVMLRRSAEESGAPAGGEPRLTFGGKTDNAQIPMQLINTLRDFWEPKKDQLAEVFPQDVCFYGEGHGAGIQKAGRLYSPVQDFVLFDIRIGDWWLERANVEQIAADLGLRVVPIVAEGTLLEGIELARRGMKSTWGDFESEGLIAKPRQELFTRKGERIITKIKTRDFR